MTRAEKLREAEQGMQEAFAQIGRVKSANRESGRMKIKPGDSKYLCAQPCLEHVKRNRAEVKRVLDENRELLDRYRLLLKHPSFGETYAPREYATQSLSAQPISTFSSFHRLWITHVAFEFANGNLEAAFADLEHDIVLLRALLRGARQYINAMGPRFSLENDVALLAEMVVARPAAEQQFNDQIEAMLAPLTSDELSWMRFIKTEMTIYLNSMLESPGTLDEWLLSPFFKRNATVNRLYAAQRLIYEWNEFSASQDEAMRQRIAQANQKLRFPYWSFAYNPVGKWELSEMDFNAYIDYFERYYDFDGLRRLVALGARLAPHAQGDIPSLIEKSDASVTDPYTAKPMKWDAVRKQVYFEPRSERWLKRKQPPIGGVQGRIGLKLLP
jgi:hypothetical protein